MKSCKKDLIKEILEINTFKHRIYTPTLCLLGARNLLGSNLETGEYEHKNLYDIEKGVYFSNLFSGVFHSVIFLEIVGRIFKPKNAENISKQNAIARSLGYFSNLSKAEIHAIRSLRNSFAHNFSLAIVGNNDNFTHKFILSTEKKSETIVQLPKEKWKGDFSDKNEETATKIYAYNLAKLVEEVYQNICNLNEKDELELTISEEELNTKFSILQ